MKSNCQTAAFRSIGIPLLALLICGCAGSNVSWMRATDTRPLGKGPYYKGHAPASPTAIGYLQIGIDGRTQGQISAKSKRLLGELLDAMNQRLRDIGEFAALPSIPLAASDAPDIYVGTDAGFHSPVRGEASESGQKMVLYTLAPSSKWRAQLQTLATEAEADLVIFVTLGISEYLPRQKNLLGSKVLDMGTGDTRALSWFTDLESAAEVLHLTGTLLDRSGRMLRSGAEAITARPTRFGVSMLGLNEAFTDNDLARVLNDERRSDLAGNPLSWQIALQNLVGQLLERHDLMVMPVSSR